MNGKLYAHGTVTCILFRVRRRRGGETMNEAVIVAGVRTAVGKAPRGALRTTRPDDMAAEVIRALLA